MADDCVFCKILAGEIPSTMVREDADTYAFRDINPAAPVHVLVIPRVHFSDVSVGITEHPELVNKVISAAYEVAKAEGVAEGWRLVFNTGAPSGQTVFHLHGHVLGYPEGDQAAAHL